MRKFPLIALVAMLPAAPALADKAPNEGMKAFTAELTRQAAEQLHRELLAKQGYITTSELRRGADGELIGHALKDGKPVSVVLKMPPRIVDQPLTN